MIDDKSLNQQLHLSTTLFDSMPMGLALFDRDLVLRRCNPAWVNFLSQHTAPSTEPIAAGRYLLEFIPEAEPIIRPIIEQVLAGQTVRRDALRVKIKGIVMYFDAVFAPLIEDGQVTGLIHMVNNVTDRKRIEERQREAEQRRRVAESLRDILTVLNSNRPLDEILNYIVAQACHLLGPEAAAIFRFHRDEGVFSAQAGTGLPSDFLELKIPAELIIFSQVMRTVEPVVISDVTQEKEEPAIQKRMPPTQYAILERFIHRFRAILAVPLIIKDELYGGISLHYLDPHEFTNEEIELAVAFADQAALAIENARLRSEVEHAAVVAERSRLARDLHDAVTQTLFSTSLIAEVLPRLWERNPEEARHRLAELRQLTRGAMAEMRTLLLELRPSALTEADLGDLLRQLTEAITGRARLPVELSIEGQMILPPEVKVAFYRIAQETLNNIAKHAAMSQVRVNLCYSPASPHTPAGRVALSVSDDGPGFDSQANAPEHLGLRIMQERAEAVGATLAIQSQLGEGTRVVVTWQDEGRKTEDGGKREDAV